MHQSDSTVRLETDARKFMREIEAWDGQEPSFRACLLNTIMLMLLCDESAGMVNDIAAEYEVAPSTVIRWANGTVRPHIIEQRRVVASLHRELTLALTPSIHP